MPLDDARSPMRKNDTAGTLGISLVPRRSGTPYSAFRTGGGVRIGRPRAAKKEAQWSHRRISSAFAGERYAALRAVRTAEALLNRYTRWVAIAAGIVLHAGIALFMGLIAFSWTMLSPYFLLLTDNEYRAVAKVLRTVGERAVGMPETSRGDILLYDGDRVVCNRFVSFVLSRNATFRATSMQSEAGRRILKEHGKDAGRMETMYVVAGYQSEAERCLERSAAVLFSMARLDSVPWRGVAFLLGQLPAGLLDAACRFVVVSGNFVRFGDGECGIEHGRRVLRNEKEGGND